MDYARIIAEAESRRRVLAAEIGALDDLIRSAKILAGVASGASRGAPAVAKPAQANPTKEATKEALLKAGGPILTRNLLTILRNRGVEVGGKDPVATLSARLSNADEFENHRGHGWWFKDRPLPGGTLLGDDSEATAKDLGGNPAAASVSSHGGSEDAAAIDPLT